MGERCGPPCSSEALRNKLLQEDAAGDTSPPYLGERSENLTGGEVLRVRGTGVSNPRSLATGQCPASRFRLRFFSKAPPSAGNIPGVEITCGGGDGCIVPRVVRVPRRTRPAAGRRHRRGPPRSLRQDGRPARVR